MIFRVHERFSSRIKDTDFTDETHFINYESDLPSLKSIALRSVAVSLWRGVDTKMCRKEYSWVDYEATEKRVLEKLTVVPLPNSMKSKVSDIIRHIGIQWLKWVNNTDFKEYSYFKDLRCKIEISSYWTMKGTFDKVKILKEVINNAMNQGAPDKDYNILFKLSCNYCLDSRTISNLYRKVKVCFKSVLEINYVEHLVCYWTYLFEDKLLALMPNLIKTDYRNIYCCKLSICENMVSLSIFLSNVFALKYFYRQLSRDQKSSNMERWFAMAIDSCKVQNRYVYQGYHEKPGRILSSMKDFTVNTDIMCILLSHMHCSKQKEVFRTHSKTILDSLLYHWQLQRFLVPTVAVMVDYLQDKEFIQFLSKLINFIVERVTTGEQLREIWQLSPLKLRKSFINFLVKDATAIVQLVKVNTIVTIDLILSDGSEDERMLILFRAVKENTFYSLIWSYDFDISVLDLMASKFLSSHLDLVLFKYSVALEHVATLVYRKRFDTADRLLNWAIESPEEIKVFKQAHINPRDIPIKSIYSGDSDFVESFLLWYFDTEEEIFQFKNNILQI